MSTRRKAKVTPALKGEAMPGEMEATVLARTLLRPTLNAALTTRAFWNVPGRELDLRALVQELSGQCAAVSRGDLQRPEAMLIAQAHTLDAIFANLANRAALNMGEHLDAMERHMRLALKAQSQCRATLETLANIKNPPMVIARQANVTSGPQQVNNGVAREIESTQNRLLVEAQEHRVDNHLVRIEESRHEVASSCDRYELARKD